MDLESLNVVDTATDRDGGRMCMVLTGIADLEDGGEASVGNVPHDLQRAAAQHDRVVHRRASAAAAAAAATTTAAAVPAAEQTR